MRVLLDTNVLLSASIDARGFSARIVDAWHSDRFELVTSTHIVEEVRRVSQYARVAKRLHGRKEDVDTLITEMQRSALPLAQKPVPQVLPDPDDNEVLAAAVEGNADYLVTGNKLHFDELEGSYKGVKIVSPREFWEILRLT